MTATVSEPDTAPSARPTVLDEDRWPRRVFLVAAVVAFPFLLWCGRGNWFFLDEWAVLDRPWFSDPGWFDPHNGHWSTLLILDYRTLFRLVGLHAYLPYQVPVVLAHVGSAVLLRVLLRRLAVRGWLATAVALIFLFFGSGRDNITFAFQIGLTGSLLAGLGLLLLADRRGPVTTADLWGLLVGVVGLMTSAVFVAMAVGAVVAILIRRGVRVAAFYAVPLGLVYAAWYLRYGRGEGEPLHPGATALRFLGRMLVGVISSLTAGGVTTLALGAVAAVGLVATVHTARRTGERRQVALLAGLLTAWFVFAALTSMARATDPFTADSHDTPRYVHIGAGLLLPVVAVGIERLARWRAPAGVLAALLLVVGVPRNIDRLVSTDPMFGSGRDLFGADSDQILSAMARSDLLDAVPADTVLPTAWPHELTAGWLADIASSGRVPHPDDASPGIGLTADSLLALQLGEPEPGLACGALVPGEALTVEAGDEIRFSGSIDVTVTDGVHRSRPRELVSPIDAAVRVLAGPLDLVVEGDPAGPPALCRPPSA